MISFRRRIFTSSGTSSGRYLEACVPGRSLYLNMKAESYPHSSISERESWWSSSVSLWKPENISVDKPQSGIMRRMAATRSIYHSRSYLRFISFRMRLLPLCTGRWMCLHTLGMSAMTWRVSSLMSLGCEVVKRIRTPGAASATVRSSIGKVIVSPSGFSKR